MADATFTFKADGAQHVTQSTDRISKGMNNVKRASSRSGYAVLEASRAFEDYSMAGMRGALNNIPPLLMGLGVGAGLTGVLAGVTVAVWKAREGLIAYTKAQDDLADKRREIKSGLGFTDTLKQEQEYSAKSIERAKVMSSTLKELADTQAYLAHVSQMGDSVANSNIEVGNAEWLLLMAKMQATEEEKRAEILNQRLQDEDRLVDKAKRDLSVSKEKLGILQSLKDEQEAIVEAGSEEKFKQIEREQRKAADIALDRAKSNGTPRERWDTLQQEASLTAKKTWEAKLFGDQTPKKALQEREVAKKKLEIINEQIIAQAKLTAKEEESVRAAEEVAKNKKRILEINEEQRQIEEKAKADEDARKRMMDERVVDTSPFLSSQGRAGLAGMEAAVAMDTIGIQKSMLKELKQIVNNTKRRGAVYS